MDRLKKIPLSYVGELHQVRLINFSVDKAEVLPCPHFYGEREAA